MLLRSAFLPCFCSCFCLLWLYTVQVYDGLAAPVPTALDVINSNISFPANVSGTYRGSWSLSQPESKAEVLPLSGVEGSVTFQLKSLPSSTDEVLDVEVINLMSHIKLAQLTSCSLGEIHQQSKRCRVTHELHTWRSAH